MAAVLLPVGRTAQRGTLVLWYLDTLVKAALVQLGPAQTPERAFVCSAGYSAVASAGGEHRLIPPTQVSPLPALPTASKPK